MIVTDYDPSRALELVRMWRASFEHGVGITDPHPIEDQLGFFESEVLPNNRVRIALEDSELIAFMASTPEAINHLYVRVGLIRHGIGTRLVTLAKSESHGSLWLHTFAQNSIARRFYERVGFTEVERSSENMWQLEAIKYHWSRGASAA